MKKFILLALFGAVSMLSASDITVEIRGSVFVPQSTRVKKLYDDHLHNYDFVVSKRINKRWDLYVEMGMICKKGRSLGGSNRSRMGFFPTTIGMKYYMPVMKQLDFYLGAGGQYGFLRVHDHSSYMSHNRFRRGAWGGIANSGFRYAITRNIFIDLFADYQFINFHFGGSRHNIRRHDFNMSGPRFGIGIGYNL